jgi:hypothetical protein
MKSHNRRTKSSYSSPEFLFPDLPGVGVYQRDLNSCSLRRKTARERWGWSREHATNSALIAETTAT